MKRVISGWTTTIAAAALLTIPLAGHGQTAGTSPAPAAPQASAASSESPDNGTDQRRLAQEHLRKADAALAGLSTAALPADAQAHVAELKQRISTLQHADAARRDAAVERDPAVEPDAPSAAPADTRRTELAAIERTLTELLGPEGTTGAPAVAGEAPVGTTGTAAALLDDQARTTLQQVRTHLTAYAAAMGSVDAEETAGAAPPSADTATAVTSPTDPTPTPTGTSPTDMAHTPAPPDATERPDDAATGVRDEESIRHLTAARNALSGLTQLPAAAELAGDARAQVSQLIRNFNELIATDTAWRASLDTVKAGLERLLSDEPVATELDPQIREKLVEFRAHLAAFEKAASSGAVSATEPATTAEPGGVATRASETDPATASGSTSTGSEVAGMPGQAADTSATAPPPAGTTAVPDEALRHIEAIEAILARHGQTDTERRTGTTGTAPPSGATPHGALDPAYVEEIRRHLNELRSLIETRGQ